MSVIYCQVCDKHVDTDFHVEHENECGKDAIECEHCKETIYYDNSDIFAEFNPPPLHGISWCVECSYCHNGTVLK